METGVSIESPIGALSTIEPRIAAKGATKSSGAVVTHIIANMVAIAKMFFIAIFVVDILFITKSEMSNDCETALNDIRPATWYVPNSSPSTTLRDSFSGYFAKRHRLR